MATKRPRAPQPKTPKYRVGGWLGVTAVLGRDGYPICVMSLSEHENPAQLARHQRSANLICRALSQSSGRK